jgi:hypothetical protein
MNLSNTLRFFKISVVICLFCFASCRSSRVYKSSVLTRESYHSSYDDTTLSVVNSSILMPYNRFIDPAGKIICFGNPAFENHSLDCGLLPDGKVLAVEDRYGVVFIDLKGNKLSRQYCLTCFPPSIH